MIHYIITAILLTVYGGEVCPFTIRQRNNSRLEETFKDIARQHQDRA